MGMKPRAVPPARDDLTDRVRQALGPRPDVEEKRMFGGIAFMVHGHMCVGTAKGDLMVRVGPDAYADALREPDARPMDFTGKPLRGFIYAEPPDQPTLERWVQRGLQFVESLPPK